MEQVFMGLLVYVLVVSALSFAMCGIDKHKAKNGKWRIRESSLFWMALLGGSPGLWVGMYVFRHKTSYLRFTIGVPAIMLSQCALLFMLYI